MSVLLDMDRHLKERLVGAAVLVLIAVLFVPELLSGPARPHNVAPAVTVSDVPTSTTPAVRTYTVNLDHPASQMPLPEDGAPPAPQSPLPSAVQAQSAPPEREPATPSADGSAALHAGASAVAPPARSEPKIEVLPAARPAAAPADVPVEAPANARAETRRETHAPASSAAASTHAPGAAAPGAAAPAAVPAPAARAAEAARPANSFAPIGEKGGWSIQLGSFANKANAEKLARGLRAKGIRVYVTQGGGKHRVRAGPFADRASADRMAGRLRAQGQSVSIIAP